MSKADQPKWLTNWADNVGDTVSLAADERAKIVANLEGEQPFTITGFDYPYFLQDGGAVVWLKAIVGGLESLPGTMIRKSDGVIVKLADGVDASQVDRILIGMQKVSHLRPHCVSADSSFSSGGENLVENLVRNLATDGRGDVRKRRAWLEAVYLATRTQHLNGETRASLAQIFRANGKDAMAKKIESLSVEMIGKIADILAERYPLNSDKTGFILKPYLNGGECTNYGLDLITAATESLGVDYLIAAMNEHDIIKAYIQKLGESEGLGSK